jgi:hypothetical protein
MSAMEDCMIHEQENRAPTYPESDGEGTDGKGSPGIVDEKTREARAGETGTTRFGMECEDTDGADSGGAVQNRNEETDA